MRDTILIRMLTDDEKNLLHLMLEDNEAEYSQDNLAQR
jgi:hypothetical protein